MKNRFYTPTYDTDLIPLWYFNDRLVREFSIVGEVRSFMGSKLPEGWLLCDGSEVSRNHYPKLFEVIGTEYGDGDGISTFDIPNIADEDSVLEYKIIKY